MWSNNLPALSFAVLSTLATLTVAQTVNIYTDLAVDHLPSALRQECSMPSDLCFGDKPCCALNTDDSDGPEVCCCAYEGDAPFGFCAIAPGPGGCAELEGCKAPKGVDDSVLTTLKIPTVVAKHDVGISVDVAIDIKVPPTTMAVEVQKPLHHKLPMELAPEPQACIPEQASCNIGKECCRKNSLYTRCCCLTAPGQGICVTYFASDCKCKEL